MFKLKHSLSVTLLLCLGCQLFVHAQTSEQNIANLTIYNAGIAEFLEERAVDLQQGYNTIVWRSLMPRANIRTVRVMAEDSEVVRVDVTYDGPQVNDTKSPVLHLVIQNRGAAARKRVQIDYLAPNVAWQSDYSLVLEPTPRGESPTAASLDSWVCSTTLPASILPPARLISLPVISLCYQRICPAPIVVSSRRSKLPST